MFRCQMPQSDPDSICFVRSIILIEFAMFQNGGGIPRAMLECRIPPRTVIFFFKKPPFFEVDPTFLFRGSIFQI